MHAVCHYKTTSSFFFSISFPLPCIPVLQLPVHIQDARGHQELGGRSHELRGHRHELPGGQHHRQSPHQGWSALAACWWAERRGGQGRGGWMGLLSGAASLGLISCHPSAQPSPTPAPALLPLLLHYADRAEVRGPESKPSLNLPYHGVTHWRSLPPFLPPLFLPSLPPSLAVFCYAGRGSHTPCPSRHITGRTPPCAAAHAFTSLHISPRPAPPAVCLPSSFAPSSSRCFFLAHTRIYGAARRLYDAKLRPVSSRCGRLPFTSDVTDLRFPGGTGRWLLSGLPRLSSTPG